MSKINLAVVLGGAGTLALVPGLAAADIIVNNVDSGFTNGFTTSIGGDTLQIGSQTSYGPYDLYATYGGWQPSYYVNETYLTGSGLELTSSAVAAGSIAGAGGSYGAVQSALENTYTGTQQSYCTDSDKHGCHGWYDYVTYSGPSASGTLMNTGTSYVGLALNIGGETHYGWAEFATDTSLGQDLLLDLIADAYETAPNTAIDVGATSDPTSVSEPGTLALMAAGLAGLALLRRRRNNTAAAM